MNNNSDNGDNGERDGDHTNEVELNTKTSFRPLAGSSGIVYWISSSARFAQAIFFFLFNFSARTEHCGTGIV